MAISLYASGTQLTSIGVEQTLNNLPTSGVYTLDLDLSPLLAGDVLEVRIYKIVLTAGTPRVVYFDMFSGAQPTDDQIKTSNPVSTPYGETNAIKWTIKQTFGSARNINWAVVRHA